MIRRARPEYGSDLIVDVLHALGVEYAAFNPGASFRGLHDSIVNHGGNAAPRAILCTHEEISVALAHGYYKASGRPMVACLHDVVGLQHACMAIYNAWCDRVPILLLGGTGAVDAAKRRPRTEWIHTALVQGDHIRDFVKWDDQPASIVAAVESMMRGWRLMSAQPSAPVYVCLDIDLQEAPLPEGAALPPDIERWIAQSPVSAEPRDLERAASELAAARSPAILAGRAGRSVEAATALDRLARALGAPVVDVFNGFNIPTTAPYDATGDAANVLAAADVVLAVDVVDLWGELRPAPTTSSPRVWAPREGARVISLSSAELLVRAWSSDSQRIQPVDIALVGDPRVALPALTELVVERVRSQPGGDRTDRLRALAAAARDRRTSWEAQARGDASTGRITRRYLALCLRDAIADLDWVLSAGGREDWVRRLWPIERPDQFHGEGGGGGVGYVIGASLGVALAHRGTGRIVVDLQSDGDLLYCSGALWTAAAERLPLLVVMDNNRSYGNSEEHARVIALRRGRPVERRGIGTRLVQPPIDYAAVARGMGVAATGPVVDPRELRPALREAVEAAASGQPYLLDVVTEQPY